MLNQRTEFVEIDFEDINTEIVQSIIEVIEQFPPFPMVAQKITQIIEQENTSAKDIADLISMDPALSAKLLSIVNSAYYNRSAGTVHHAVALLGLSEIKNLVTGLKVIETFSGDEFSAVDQNLFWEHSVACGLCAKRLADHVRQIPPGEAFLGGLLHDIGKMVFALYLQDQWNTVKSRSDNDSLLFQEKKIIGVTHQTAGKWLADHWKLPEPYGSVIQYHHEIPEEDSKINARHLKQCAVIYAANILVRDAARDSGECGLLKPEHEKALNLIGLHDQQVFEDVLIKTFKELTDWKTTFGI